MVKVRRLEGWVNLISAPCWILTLSSSCCSMLDLPCSAPCQVKSVGLDAIMILTSMQGYPVNAIATVCGIVYPIKTYPKLALVNISFAWKYWISKSVLWRLKCTKFVFGRGSDPDPAGEAYSAPPDPLAGGAAPSPRIPPRSRHSSSIFDPSGLKLQLPPTVNFPPMLRGLDETLHIKGSICCCRSKQQ